MRGCANCGESLDGHRSHARYCSGRCRAAAARKRTLSGAAAPRGYRPLGHVEETAQKRTYGAVEGLGDTKPTSAKPPAPTISNGWSPCGYESHRGGRDWLADGGRVECGVCHPPWWTLGADR
jgi:hypothetical protein